MGRRAWGVVGAVCVSFLARPAAAADCEAADGPQLLTCADQLEAGDTLTLAAGTFEIANLTLDGLHGQPGAPIVLRGTLGPDGELLSHIVGQSSGSNVVEIVGSSHLELRDLELSFVDGTTGNGVDLIKFSGMGDASHHIDIVRCELHDTGNVAIGSQAREIHDIRVLDCHIHDIGGSCFYWGYYEDDNPLRWAHDSVIADNLLQRCPADPSSETHYGIQLKSGNADNVIADNVLVDVGGTTRAGIIVYHSAPKPVGEPLGGSNLIAGNLLVRPRNEGINAAAGARVINNIVVDAGGIAIFLQPRSYGGATYYGSLEVAHNTVVQTVGGAGAHGIRWTAGDWSLADPQRPSAFVANLALVSNGADGLRPPSASATVDGNATDANANGAANTIALVDPITAVQALAFGELGYLVPTADGPLDGAAPATDVGDDFAGQTRSADAPDIGAYEWLGELPPALDEDEPKPGDTGDESGDESGETGDSGESGDESGESGESGDESGSGTTGDDTGVDGDESDDESGGGPGESEPGDGCSCSSHPTDRGPAWLALIALLGLGLGRRRPTRSRR